MFVQQWAEVVKHTTKTIKDAMEIDTSEFNKYIGGFGGVDDLAQIGKAYMDSSNELTKAGNSALNSMFKNYLDYMDINSTADAVKNFNDIRVDAVNQLTKNYQDWVNIFWSTDVNQTESLRKVNNYQDITALVMNSLDEMQTKLKDNFLDSMQIWVGIESATKLCTTRMIDNMAGAVDTPPPIKGKQPSATRKTK
jgi:hypothetical protein